MPGLSSLLQSFFEDPPDNHFSPSTATSNTDSLSSHPISLSTSFAESEISIPLARGNAGKQLLQRQLNQAQLYLAQAAHTSSGLRSQIEALAGDITGLNDYTSKAKEQARLALTNPAIHTDILRQADNRCLQEEEERLAEAVENASQRYTPY